MYLQLTSITLLPGSIGISTLPKIWRQTAGLSNKSLNIIFSYFT